MSGAVRTIEVEVGFTMTVYLDDSWPEDKADEIVTGAMFTHLIARFPGFAGVELLDWDIAEDLPEEPVNPPAEEPAVNPLVVELELVSTALIPAPTPHNHPTLGGSLMGHVHNTSGPHQHEDQELGVSR